MYVDFATIVSIITALCGAIGVLFWQIIKSKNEQIVSGRDTVQLVREFVGASKNMTSSLDSMEKAIGSMEESIRRRA